MALMTTAQAADFLAVKTSTVRSMIRIGSLPAVKLGSEYRIDEVDLNQFIEKNRVIHSP